MKPIQRILLGAAFALGVVGFAWPAAAQQVLVSPLAIDQTQLLYHTNLIATNFSLGVNWQSYRGVPLSTNAGSPPGSDGRAPSIQEQNSEGLTTLPPTTNQFQGFVGASAIPVQSSTSLNTSKSFSANVQSLNWPRATSDGTPNGNVVFILRAAQVGAPYFAQSVSFYFGAVIPPPSTDENGISLPTGDNLSYWLPQPYTTNDYTNAPYYWSPNARAVFAIQAGGIDITWEKSTPTNQLPLDYTNYVTNSGVFYRLYKVHYLVSGAAVKTPQKMYWTEGAYQQTGHLIDVPQARVSVVNVVYNQNFPANVYPGDTASAITNTKTLWFSQTPPYQIHADNIEGRVFVELLGELNPDGVTRRFLGFEIVDVYKEPVPDDVTVYLGNRVPAFQDGADDSNLDPSPIQNLNQAYYYQQNHSDGQNPTLWATQLTTDLNDFEVHWLITGVAGLQWPYVFDRYAEVWPTDPSLYVNYVRPATTTPDEAALTGVQLPSAEAPSIAYQDPLDQLRGFLSANGLFYTMLNAQYPAQRTLIQFLSGENVSYERVFSYLDSALKDTTLFTNSVANTLNGWDTNSLTLSFPSQYSGPSVVSNTVYVGSRITAPSGELGFGSTPYVAGYINQTNGNSFNPNAYLDPFNYGFVAANEGSIIPVNAIPGSNTLEVWWFRSDNVDASQGFAPSYWPAVIGHYTIQWPTDAPEIIMANNAGTGPLDSLQAKGDVYRQPNRNLPGYNPNEEHALMMGGQGYALCDDLNITNGTGYTSDPFVLIEYVGSDGRPSMAPYHVRREAPERAELFDYIVQAGTMLQAPMPLPLLDQPVEGAGSTATNYDSAPSATAGDLPADWNNSLYGTSSSNYAYFTYQDRKHNFWVYRGLNSGLPPLQAGAYNTNNSSFGPLPPGQAMAGQPFSYYIQVSRQVASLTVAVSTNTPLPDGLTIGITTNGVALTGTPTVTSSNTYLISIGDIADGASINASLSLVVTTNGGVLTQGPLVLHSTNQYSGAETTYLGRPPFLATPAAPSNSFTMRFYYKNEATFDWPGYTAPAVGAIVPYLRPLNGHGGYVGDPTAKTTVSQDIVYRPVWPTIVDGNPVPTLFAGQTLTTPVNGLPEIRGQASVQILYQESIATNNITEPSTFQSAILYDPTVEKKAPLAAIPAGVLSTSYQGKNYFQNLPPNLAQRFWFDPNTTNLVLEGQFVNDIVGLQYLLPNILDDNDSNTLVTLCPAADPAYSAWVAAIQHLSTPLYTFGEALDNGSYIPGSYVDQPNDTLNFGPTQPVVITSSDQQVDSYAMCATGPGEGYLSFIVNNGINPSIASDPIQVYVIRVAPQNVLGVRGLYSGQLKVIQDPNPLSQLITFQHTSDLAGRATTFQYDYRIAPPVNGLPPTTDPTNWTVLTNGLDVTHFTFGSSGIQGLGDNYVAMRYRDTDVNADPATTNWSTWTSPAFAEGWITRVLAGVNPFNQRTSDLFDNPVNTTGTIIQQAGSRWEGDVALNEQSLTNSGLISIYETVLHVGENLSINAGYNYGPANQALLEVAGYLSDLYSTIGNDAYDNSLNPTISIGTDNTTYGAIATSLFCFQGEVSTLLDQDLALLRGRDDSLQPGVTLAPVYNRLYWNYTLGIDAGEVIYALNYNIQDENGDGVINAADAALLYPMGHGDAYGHYLTALSYYYSLLMNPNFDWVPQIQTVSVLGAAISVNYENERKFAADAAAIARTGRQIFDLTWREDYQSGTAAGWDYMGVSNVNTLRPYLVGGNQTNYVTKYWGLDHWAARVGQGAYLHWLIGNAILPPVDPNPDDQGIQKVDRTTVPELVELPQTEAQLQADMDNANAGFTPLNYSQNAVPFDINPLQVTGPNPQTHFEQIYQRAVTALNNAVVAFNSAQGVTEQLRQTQNSLSDYQAGVNQQELAYNNQLIGIYGTPYPDDMGPGKTYPQGYTGPDLIHYTYVQTPATNTFGGILPDPTQPQTYYVDIQQLPTDWSTTMYSNLDSIIESTAPGYTNNPSLSVAFNIGPDGFFDKPSNWTSQRAVTGTIQQSISKLMAAQDTFRNDVANAVSDKQSLDKAMNAFNAQYQFEAYTTGTSDTNLLLQNDIANIQEAYNIANAWEQVGETIAQDVASTLAISIPDEFIVGLADGGDEAKPIVGAIYGTALIAKWVLLAANAGQSTAVQVESDTDQTTINNNTANIQNATFDNDMKNAVLALGAQENALQGDLGTINTQEQAVSDAQAAYENQVAAGNQVQAERLSFRQSAAAAIQTYRVENAAFGLFQNEDLQRYLTLFNTAQQYAYLAAQAYDYETGLLNTSQGQAFLKQIISSQAIGVVNGGQPQVTGSDEGDPGISSALAEMYADWSVLKGRLGFNNPDGYGTTVSLRTENYRILGSSDGDSAWQQILQNGRVANLLADPDVARYCLQVDNGSGLPVPGIELTFSTMIADGYNLFGNQLAAGDHNFSDTSFATKIFSVGVDLDGYVGMDNPSAGGGVSPPDPTTDPNALSATPYIYLIPVGSDSMRTPPLGDTSTIRTWNIDDVAIPLPYNVSANDFSSTPFYTSANSLSEPLFAIRKYQAFRPVSTTSVFNPDIFGADGSLQPSQYTNTRLIGRSVWNSKWKLIIPGQTLLSDPNEGLDRFINSVKDVKLYFITYSYAGN